MTSGMRRNCTQAVADSKLSSQSLLAVNLSIEVLDPYLKQHGPNNVYMAGYPSLLKVVNKLNKSFFFVFRRKTRLASTHL